MCGGSTELGQKILSDFRAAYARAKQVGFSFGGAWAFPFSTGIVLWFVVRIACYCKVESFSGAIKCL